MFNKKHSKPQNRIDTLIGTGTVIDGNISFSGGMRIDGQVNGDVIAAPGKPSTLVLSEQGCVHGEVNVTHLVVNGVISGAVTASEYLELHVKARVTGDVHYKLLEIQAGAVLDGRLNHINLADHEKVVVLKTGIN
ncbi:MAG: polymer-forming cytoskeletal protein [Proteobacteria bacterium]|nr:polymer-forming cytoskeletal protein [Pseudomonadota bacterium]